GGGGGGGGRGRFGRYVFAGRALRAAAGVWACRAQGNFASARRHCLGGGARSWSQARRPRHHRARATALPPRGTPERKRQRPPARCCLARMVEAAFPVTKSLPV